jgi:DNA helicase-2/ATP-dependent DNA helicase PcrA
LARALRLPPPTSEQAAAIEAPLTPALVVAGAGSGKTETMAARVVYLVANGLVRPDQVLGLTFTRKAAGQLGERIRRRLGGLAGSGLVNPAVLEGLAGAEPEVSTYHAFGGRLIAEYGPLVGVEPSASVLTPTAAWQLARRVVGRWDGDLETDLSPDNVTEKLLAISGALGDHLTDTAALADELATLLHTLTCAPQAKQQRNPLHSSLVGHVKRLTDRRWILPLVDAFTEAKRASGTIDFADQMQLAAELVTAHPSIGPRLRDRFSVVLLDEYQDTGHAQREILRTLFGAGTGHPVTAVGDPVQSIYSWRGAAASNLPRFGTDFALSDGSAAPRLTLLTSFRNPITVLDLANAASAGVRGADRSGVAVPGLRARPDAPAGVVRHGLFETVVDEDDWVATAIADAWAKRPTEPPTTAVLLRRRRDMAGIVAALETRGIPVEVVGLGGLLDEPEVADLVSVLRLLVDPTAGAAALRVLTGARWRISAADLEALARRSRGLAGRHPVGEYTDPLDALRAAVAEAVTVEDDLATLVDALSDPGPAEGYSVDGYRRLTALAGELQRLRGRLTQPLTDLVADVERTIGLDVEAAVAGGEGRAHLDAFADVVADVAGTGAGLPELLDYLATADEREDGLAPAEIDHGTGRVQILTVHAAKGLEWEMVAVPHLCTEVFPGSTRQSWLGDAAQLPPALRGDRADIPELRLPPGGDQKELGAALDAHIQALKADQLAEERRLLYVALTRAEHTLLFSAHFWPVGTVKPKGPSEFFTELVAVVAETPGSVPEVWAHPPADGVPNPLNSVARTAAWPVDPLGDRRAQVTAGSELVRSALDRIADRLFDDLPVDDPYGWERDVSALLAERAATAAPTIDVDLPGSLSVSALARRIRRPVPVAPAPQARRGTAFHAWLEHRFGLTALLDLDELPGSADGEAAPDVELSRLQDAFLASAWADRVPTEVEVPFATRVAGLGLRGRIDAIFADPDGGYTVIDWKSCRLPPPARRDAAAVQLAAYRLAWSRLAGVPLDRVRAAFHYVADNVTLAPVNLLDAEGLARLVADATVAASIGAGR